MADDPDLDPRWHGNGNYLDWLMTMDPLELSAQNIDSIIEYQRRARGLADAGVRPKRGVAEKKIDLTKIGLVKKGPAFRLLGGEKK